VDRPHSVRLLLADAHALTRSALGNLLANRPGVAMVGEAATLAEACRLAEQEMPDVILLYVRPDNEIGVGGVQPLLKAAGPAARVLLLADAAGAELHRRAVRVGAYGVVGTDRPPESLLKAIDKVSQGEVWMERRFVADLIGPADVGPESDHARIGSLTPREREVVGLLCEGLRNKQIADRLAVTDVTVRHHLTSVFSKLGVSDRLGLLLYASRHGLVPADTYVPDRVAYLTDAGVPADR
jgi:DNA-binding NarL/FixJ family response regulator